MSCDTPTVLRATKNAECPAGNGTPSGNYPALPRDPSDGYIIYTLEELGSGRHYVGLTRRSLPERIASHVSQARRDRRIRPGGLMAALRLMDSLGQSFAACFSARILARACTAHEARALERYWVDRLECRTPHGLNQMPGGSSVGGIDNAQSLSVIAPDGVARTYSSIRHAIAAYNTAREANGQPRLEPSTVYARIAGGWTAEEALGFKPRRYPGSVRRAFAIGDALYTTLLEASAATGLSPATLSSRLHRFRQSGLEGVPQIGEDRRARGNGRLDSLSIPWPGTKERLTAAAFAARTGLPKGTVIHRWHRAQTVAKQGGHWLPKALHIFLSTRKRPHRPAAGGAGQQANPG